LPQVFSHDDADADVGVGPHWPSLTWTIGHFSASLTWRSQNRDIFSSH